MRVLKPDTEDQVVEAIRDADGPLAIEGRGTMQGFGRPVATETVLRLAGLTGVTMYEPDEMVFTARAGTPLKEIEETLSARNQHLAFEPGDLGPLWDTNDGASIGGVIAAAIAGPRRFAAGAARDHLLGFVAVNGKGERFKAGGRVVKNVTGYDLPKLAAGSFGTLFAMTEVTLRALPRGRATAYLALENKDPTEALRTLRAVAGSPFEPSGLVSLPARVASRIAGSAQPIALIRLEGDEEGVAARAAELTRTIAAGARTFDKDEGARLFRAAADIHPLFDKSTSLWRISVPPSRAHNLVIRITPDAWFADAAGGMLWLEYATPDVARIHASAQEHGGHATLIRRGAAQTDDVFPPLDAPTRALTERLKLAFDPARRLNPGRMHKDV